MELAIDGQAPQQNDTDGAAGQLLPSGNGFRLKRASDERIVALNLSIPVGLYDNLGDSKMTVRVLPCLLAEKAIQRLFTTIESIAVMLCTQQLDIAQER